MSAIDELLTDAAVIAELGARLERHRLERNLTREEIATAAGVGTATLQRLEGGQSVQLTSLVRVLRALELLDGLDRAIPADLALPIEQLERDGAPRRRRATGRRGRKRATQEWTWGDEP